MNHRPTGGSGFWGRIHKVDCQEAMINHRPTVIPVFAVLIHKGEESIMEGAMISPLVGWQNFYVIIGSAAAALTGLMFVAVTLITNIGLRRAHQNNTFAAFSTPTVVYLGTALLIAAILSAPWQVLWNVSVLLALCGLSGITYVTVILRRMRRQGNYKPVMEDWIWHTFMPFIAYIALTVGALGLSGSPFPMLFIIGAAMVLFLFIGIHNAWDTVTYIAIELVVPNNRSQEDVPPDKQQSEIS